MWIRVWAVAALLVVSFAGLAAQDAGLGPETNLPLPRFVSLKAEKANVRRGPGMTHRIDWIFLRRGMPLEIVAEHGHWRKVRDVDEASGWIHHVMLRGRRTAVVTAKQASLRIEPGADKTEVARAEAGAILSVERCGARWCEVEGRGHSGWIRKTNIWGVRDDETFD